MNTPRPGDGMTNAWPPPPKPPKPQEPNPGKVTKSRGEVAGQILTAIVALMFLIGLVVAVRYVLTDHDDAQSTSAVVGDDWNEIALGYNMAIVGIAPNDVEFITGIKDLCTQSPIELAQFLQESTEKQGYFQLIELLAGTCPSQMAKVNIVRSNTHTTP